MSTPRKVLSHHDLRTVSAGVWLVGAGLILAGLLWGWQTQAFLNRATAARGIITQVIAYEGKKHRTYYKPVIAFTDARGIARGFTAQNGTTAPRYAVGEEVSLYYDPQDPEEARLDEWYPLWGAPTGLGFIGIVILMIGVIFNRLLGKRADPNAPSATINLTGGPGPRPGG
ncbi:MAG TPA: DUF3592 domain-containing protein [Planctomycetota bacterium]|nr:DUF3592 domain-containing protein [Planctomycetota bacterium]